MKQEPEAKPPASIIQRDDRTNVLVVLRGFQRNPFGLKRDKLIEEVIRCGQPFARARRQDTVDMVLAVLDELEEEDKLVVCNGTISYCDF